MVTVHGFIFIFNFFFLFLQTLFTKLLFPSFDIDFKDFYTLRCFVKCLEKFGVHELYHKRALFAIEEAEAPWGRNTLFDEYSKLLVIANRSRGRDDLAFIGDFFVVGVISCIVCGSIITGADEDLLILMEFVETSASSKEIKKHITDITIMKLLKLYL